MDKIFKNILMSVYDKLSMRPNLEKVMNKEIIEGNWEILKGKLKQQWGKLTDDDLKEIKGNRQILVGKIQSKYGYTKEEIEKSLDNF